MGLPLPVDGHILSSETVSKPALYRGDTISFISRHSAIQTFLKDSLEQRSASALLARWFKL